MIKKAWSWQGRKNKNYSSIISVSLLVGIWYLFIGKDLLGQMAVRSYQTVEAQKVYYAFPCSEANLARIIGITWTEEAQKANDQEVIQKEVASAEGLSQDTLWYEPYYSQLESIGVTSLKVENAFDLLSSTQLEQVFKELTGQEILIENKQQLQLYEVLAYYEEALNIKNKVLQYQTTSILATPTDEQDLSAWQVATSSGKYHFEGLVLDPLKGKTVKMAYCKEQVLGITEIISNQSLIKDCKVVEIRTEEAQFEVGGTKYHYKNQALDSEDVGKVGTIVLEDGKIVDFIVEATQKIDTLVRLSEGEIVLEKGGSFTYSDISVEDRTGTEQYNEISDLVYGLKVAYSEETGKITRLQVLSQSTLKEIRVLLSSIEGGYTHEEVMLSSEEDYDMIYKNEATTFSAGRLFKASEAKWQEGECIRFVPRSEESQLTLSGLEKGESTISYYGIIEVIKTAEGYQIINEVDLEHYVAGVLPSEMPTSYPMEALKAQAIAIRTYGMSCIESGRFMSYGAHVDDTIASQVYNRMGTDEKAMTAAKETAGLVLRVDGKLISNKFFAASCGYTANFGEVWAGQEFPSDTPSYLVSRQQYLGEQMVTHLEQEENFKTFMALGAEDLDAFDEESPWFRWQVKLSVEELTKLIKPALVKLYPSYSTWIQIDLKGEGSTEEKIEGLGEICKLEILKRGQGGNAMTLAIQFEAGKVQIETEYLIRSLFSSNNVQDLTIIRGNGTTVSQMTLLPSAFFYIEENRDHADTLEGMTLIGGGNGHGVGLSQDGAKGMAERGYHYEEILRHYYGNCEIE